MRVRARRVFVAAALAGGFTLLIGCQTGRNPHAPPVVEEYKLPPDETRYNEPDTAGYRKPTDKRDEKSLMNRGGKRGGPLTPGGF